MRAALVALLLLLASATQAVHLGRIGPTQPIAEPDLLDEIAATLEAKEKSGELARLEAEAKARVVRSIESPAPIDGVRRTTAPRVYFHDPSVVAAANITDAQGRVLIPAGTRRNPLDQVSLASHLMFFDGRDREQVAFARHYLDAAQVPVKPILVGGSYMALMRAWKRPVFHDQDGSLVKKLAITQVPAVVSQDGKRLRIAELEPR